MTALPLAAWLPAATMFAVATSITPGPNNSLLMASGANFGLRRTMPVLAGVVGGYITLIAACGLGLGAVFTAIPPLRLILKWGGAAYLIYLAWKIATASGIGSGGASAQPIGFARAAALQAVNPKAWIIALATASAYIPASGYFANLALVLVVFAIVSVVACVTWTSFGVILRRWLDRPAALRAFNVVMAALLISSLIPLLREA